MLHPNATHGDSSNRTKTPELNAWNNMMRRCYTITNPRYHAYGGRGILVCRRWFNYVNFLADMGRRPSSSHSLERRDNDGHYTPDNCLWATAHDQMINRRGSFYATYQDEQWPLSELAVHLGVPANTLRFRILKGWSEDQWGRAVRPKWR